MLVYLSPTIISGLAHHLRGIAVQAGELHCLITRSRHFGQRGLQVLAGGGADGIQLQADGQMVTCKEWRRFAGQGPQRRHRQPQTRRRSFQNLTAREQVAIVGVHLDPLKPDNCPPNDWQNSRSGPRWLLPDEAGGVDPIGVQSFIPRRVRSPVDANTAPTSALVPRLDWTVLLAVACLVLSWFFMSSLITDLGVMRLTFRFYNVLTLMHSPARIALGPYGSRATLDAWLFGTVCGLAALAALAPVFSRRKVAWLGCVAPFALMV